MAIINVRDRKLAADDVAWGVGSYTYTDANGVVRTIPEINAATIPVTGTQNVYQGVLDIIAVADAGSLTAAVGVLGSTPGTIYLRRGTYIFTVDPAVPANIRLWFENEAIINADNCTVTLDGPIEAGPYQIFSWTGSGAIDISASPTATVLPEWWGAVAETSGWTYDNVVALTKMAASIERLRQEVFLLRGWYRIATPWALGNSGFRCKGSGIFTSGFWIDLTGGIGTGVTFGDGTTASEAVELSDFGFIGPSNCCEYGVDFRVSNPHTHRVNFCMGSTAYACRTRSCEVYDMVVYSYPNNSQPIDTAYPAGVFTGDHDPITTWANNTFTLDIQTLGNYTLPPLYLDRVDTNIKITGSIQSVSSPVGPFVINSGAGPIDIANLYSEGLTGDAIITNCQGVSLREMEYFLDKSTLRLINCDGTKIDGGFIWNLYINAGCRGTKINSLNYLNCIDESPDTAWGGDYFNPSAYSYRSNKDKDKVNLWQNTSFNRWRSDRPDGGWGTGNTVWTKSGLGIASPNDIHHLSPYCAKAATNGGNASWTITLDAAQLSRVRGQVITHSLWEYFPAGQTLDDGVTAAYYRPFTWSITNTVPVWASGSYKINDAVVPTVAWLAAHAPPYADNGVNGNMWVCTVAGTTGATEPTWGTALVDAGTNAVVVDGGVTWVVKPRNVDIYHANPYRATMQGTWHQDALHIFVPNTATAVTFGYSLIPQAGGAGDATVYLAEPTLVVSNQTPTALVESVGEFQKYIQVGGVKLWAVTPGAGEWVSLNDLDLSNQKKCTVAGDGATATWAAW